MIKKIYMFAVLACRIHILTKTLWLYVIYLFSHLADAFIQSDL